MAEYLPAHFPSPTGEPEDVQSADDKRAMLVTNSTRKARAGASVRPGCVPHATNDTQVRASQLLSIS